QGAGSLRRRACGAEHAACRLGRGPCLLPQRDQGRGRRARGAGCRRGRDAGDRPHLRPPGAPGRGGGAHGRGMERPREPEAYRHRRETGGMSLPRAAAPRMKGGLDLGGTKIQAVVTDGEANVLGTARRETPPGGPEKVMLELAETMRAALDDAGVELMGLAGVGVGAPGSIDADSGTVLQVPNIDGWHAPYPLGPALQEELGRPVGIGNDVNVAVEAERRFG